MTEPTAKLEWRKANVYLDEMLIVSTETYWCQKRPVSVNSWTTCSTISLSHARVMRRRIHACHMRRRIHRSPWRTRPGCP